MTNTPVSSVCVFVLNKGVHAPDLQCLFVLHCIPGSQRGQAIGESSHGTALTASIKTQVNRSRPPQTPTHPSLMGPSHTPASRLPRKTLGPLRSLTEANVHNELSEGAGSTQGEPNKDLHFGNGMFKLNRLLHKGRKSAFCRLFFRVRPCCSVCCLSTHLDMEGRCFCLKW